MPNAHSIGWVLPALHQRPGGQTTHSVRSAFAYLPATHVVHRGLRGSGATMPEAHGSCTVLPCGAKYPGVVELHSSALCRWVWLLKVPAAHGMGLAVPSGQNECGVHGLHADWPVAS